MKIQITILLFLCFSLATSGQRVLIIGIDGCRSDVAEIAETPNLDNLKLEGIYSHDGLNDDITISGPGWSGILCGVRSPKHLVTNNNFSGNNYAEYPSIFARVEDHDENLNTYSVCHWSPINTWIVGNDADVTTNVSSDQAVEDELVSIFTNDDPHLVFAHFDEIDHAGHAHGFAADVPEYVSAIEDVDTHIGNVYLALKARPNFAAENWIVILTSDHGGLNFGHGGNSLEERRVPFIVSGDSIPVQIIEHDSILFLDTAYNCLGDTIPLVFDGNNDYVQVPHISDYDFGATQDFTLECRVKTSEAADVAIIGNKNWNSGSNKGFVFSFKFSSGPEWKVNVGDGSNRIDINTGGSVANNEWHTLSVSFDRDGMAKMYENGTFVDEIAMASIGDIDNGEDLFFGTDINQDFDYNGAISEVRIWNTALTAQEISDYACDTIDTAHPSYLSLQGYWRMNEGSGSIVADNSTNSNTGTINNAEWTIPDTMWIDDYSYTPKIIDASISALGHMCIPIDTAWNLDGNSWVADCIYNQKDCVNPGYNTWIGPNVGMWNDSEHWSRGFIPLICDNVVIPPGNEIIVEANYTGVCHTLQMDDSSALKLLENARLEITIE